MKKISVIIVICILLESILILSLNNSYRNKRQIHLKEKSTELRISYKKVVETFEVPAQLFFNGKIKNEEILKLFSKAKDADSLQQVIIRDSLYNYLIDSYNNLKNFNYRQLHFHLPNNTSFLRFHRPAKYGDNLTQVRSTVSYTNEKNKYSHGFEEGKIFNGFRYVFPLTYKKNHIGSVETSVSFRAITNQIEKNRKHVCDFIILKKVVNEKVFDSEKSNYTKCTFSGKFLFEKEGYNQIKSKIVGSNSVNDLMVLLKKDAAVSNILNQFKEESIYFKTDKNYIVISFCPIENFDGIPVAYIISYQVDNDINDIKRNFYLSVIIANFLLIIIVAFILYILYSRKRALVRIEKIKQQHAEIEEFSAKLESKNRLLQESENKLVKNNEKLKLLNATKDKFFSIISHDLKSPFGAILGYSEMLLTKFHKYSDEKKLEVIQIIIDASKRSYNLLENLLTWSRSQSGRIKYNPEKMDLKIICESLTELYKSQAEEKGVLLTNNVLDSIELISDRNILETVLRNLISNAIKYTSKGDTITLDCKLNENNNKVILSVRDTGTGMSNEDLEKLFKIDESISNPGTNDEKGTGLGLILCKDLLQMAGGIIEVESELGKGSVFKFTLPTNKI